MPAEAAGIQNVPFQIDKTHRPQTMFPKSACGMQQIEMRGQFVKERILFRKVAHEELFDLKSPCVPPGEPDEKGVCSRAPCQTGGLCIEKEPLVRIFQSGACTARYFGVTSAGKKFE